MDDDVVRLAWVEVDRGVWVANQGGAFAGMIDRQGGSHFVRNAFSEYLGDFGTLDAAQAALSNHVGASTAGPSC